MPTSPGLIAENANIEEGQSKTNAAVRAYSKSGQGHSAGLTTRLPTVDGWATGSNNQASNRAVHLP